VRAKFKGARFAPEDIKISIVLKDENV